MVIRKEVVYLGRKVLRRPSSNLPIEFHFEWVDIYQVFFLQWLDYFPLNHSETKLFRYSSKTRCFPNITCEEK